MSMWKEKNDLIDRYNLLEKVKNTFWDHWSSEYLPELTYFAQSRNTKVKEIEVGEIVLIENDQKRGKWKLARIEKLIVGRYGKVRAAEVKTNCKKLTQRPIQKVYPLEIASNEDISSPVPAVPQSKAQTSKKTRKIRSRRDASESIPDCYRACTMPINREVNLKYGYIEI